MEIVIGSGNYVVSGIGRDGRIGVYIGLLENHGQKVDSNADKDSSKSTSQCIIWFANLKSARMFQDQVNIACLRMNGYEVSNT